LIRTRESKLDATSQQHLFADDTKARDRVAQVGGGFVGMELWGEHAVDVVSKVAADVTLADRLFVSSTESEATRLITAFFDVLKPVI
jgi:hypothetical protein